MTASRLLNSVLRERLLSNGLAPDIDHVPVVKLFNPTGAGTWLATELAADEDTMFGLADLGFGYPEMGSFSLAELEMVRLPFGMHIERDRTFSTEQPLSVWSQAARAAASLNAAEQILRAARLGQANLHEDSS